MGTTPLPPDLQSELALLFQLFSAYVAATPRERSGLRDQIIDVFSRLGVVSDYAVRQAADMFDRIRRDRPPAPVRETIFGKKARAIVNAKLHSFEHERGSASLSRGARQLLRVPVVEAVELTEQLDEQQIVTSLDRVLRSVKEPPLAASEGNGRVRTSIAVIRALYNNFCSIPPFCAGTKK